jgi:hypothetical protein
MASFHYRAVTGTGQWQEGTRQGTSDKAVARDLQSMGLVPVYVGVSEAGAPRSQNWLALIRGKSEPHSGQSLWLSLAGRRATGRDRLLFTQELATLLNAGVPLDRALSICSELTESKFFRTIVADVLRQVKSGKSLADALEAQGKVFSKLHVNMVRAGQASGSLHVVLQRLAEFEESSAEWRAHLISSMIYPALLTLVAIASILVLMNFVVPRDRLADALTHLSATPVQSVAPKLWLDRLVGPRGGRGSIPASHRNAARSRTLGPLPVTDSPRWGNASQVGDGPFCKDDVYVDCQQRSSGAVAQYCQRNGRQSGNGKIARGSRARRKARRGSGRSGSESRRFSTLGRSPPLSGRRDRAPGCHVRASGNNL